MKMRNRIFTFIICLMMTLGLFSSAFALEKRYVVDNTGALTEEQLKELNNRAAGISRKHNLDVAFFLADNDYAPDQSLYAYLEKCYNDFIGSESDGFMLAWDGKIRVWMMIAGGKGKIILPKVNEEQFFDAFRQGKDKTFHSRIMAYLDAADKYLSKMNINSTFMAHAIFNVYLAPILLLSFPVLIIIIILSIILNAGKQYKYIGMQAQKRRNNFRSMTMLFLFPYVVIMLTFIFSFFVAAASTDGNTEHANTSIIQLKVMTIGFGVCLVWLLIAYFFNSAIISAATNSKSLERRDNKRVYNLVENLCIATQTAMPKINVIEDDSLNAFASGINKKSFTITLSRGLIDKLDDQELEAVIGHELAHIRNNDVKVMIVSIVFVGIFTFLTLILFGALFSRRSRSGKDIGTKIGFILIGLIIAAIGYLITTLMRFAISRNREYLADAGSAEMTKNPLALASALRKISADPYIEAVSRKDVAQLFIDNPLPKGTRGKAAKKSLFATHPPIEERIKILEQF